ncbi:hypothetical protein PMIN04_012947 [Paraphaeosphaeria minitans]
MPTADHGLAMESAEAQHRDLDEPGASEKRETAVNPEPSPSVEEGEQVNHLHGSPLVLLIVSLTLAVAVVGRPARTPRCPRGALTGGRSPWISRYWVRICIV